MSGFHGHHHHGDHEHSLVRPSTPRSRRLFLTDIGRVTVGLAFTAPILAACSSDTASSPASTTGTASTSGEDQIADSAADSSTQTDELRWGRAELGFVSAYVLARGNRAAIVDTGTAGSATSIGVTLSEMGLTYDDVDHLILTHSHADHAGSTGEVLEMATGATVYAGQADIEGIDVDGLDADAISALTGGEDVFGLATVSTPGHTPGHMAVLDQASGLLVAGDALFTENGAVIEGPERFFDNIPQSQDTIRMLAELTINTLLVGHGEPIEQNAGAAIAELAAQLPS